jgi:hypothetical protein
VDLQRFQLTAPPGVLDGVDRLFIRLTPPPGSALPPITLVDYVAGQPAPERGGAAQLAGDVVSVDLSGLGVNLMDYLGAEQLTMDVQAEGTLPAAEWNATVETCFGLDAAYDLGDELGI